MPNHPKPARRFAPFLPARLKPWLALSMALPLALPAAATLPLGCLIEADRVAEVGSPVIGVIDRVEVERGDRITKGQVLAVLRAPVERASLNVASSRADANAELQAAMAAASFNRERLARADDLFRQQFVSRQALDQARSESELSEQKLIAAQEQRQLSRQEREVAQAQVWQRVIRSPIDGVVAERYASAGERVDDKPLLRIAKVDPLRVQLVVPVAMYLQVQPGAQFKVVPELPGAVPVSARVTMIDRVIDPASNTFRVHLELPNPNGALPAGLRCKAEFEAAVAAAASQAPQTATTAELSGRVPHEVARRTRMPVPGATAVSQTERAAPPPAADPPARPAVADAAVPARVPHELARRVWARTSPVVAVSPAESVAPPTADAPLPARVPHEVARRTPAPTPGVVVAHLN